MFPKYALVSHLQDTNETFVTPSKNWGLFANIHCLINLFDSIIFYNQFIWFKKIVWFETNIQIDSKRRNIFIFPTIII